MLPPSGNFPVYDFRRTDSLKGYSKKKSIYLCPAGPGTIPGTAYFSDSSGCFLQGQEAEMIPVEPDQGNACAGKVVQNLLLFTYAAFLTNQFLNRKS
jgi:hypothetical protein